ncbi:unnamed protein product [Chrysoparadoxa australica]
MLPAAPTNLVGAFGAGLFDPAEKVAIASQLQSRDERRKEEGDFVNSVYSLSNSALALLQSGQVAEGKEATKLAQDLVATRIEAIDQGASKSGVREERVSNCLEALAKVEILEQFFKTGVLVSKSELGSFYRDEEYLGGVMGLLEELVSYSVGRASDLDVASITLCRDVMVEIQGELMLFDFRNGGLRRRYDGVKYHIKKMNDILYALSLVQGAPEAAGDGAPAEKRQKLSHDADGAETSKLPALVEIGGIRARQMEYDEKREQVIKRARDIQKPAKLAIYDIHRDSVGKSDQKIADCIRVAKEMLPVIQELPRLRYGSFGNAMEELAEAKLFRVWVSEKRLCTRAEMEVVEVEEYLGGLFDLTGEINRYAVKCATARDTERLGQCLETVLVIDEFLKSVPLPFKLNKKMKELGNSLSKMKNMTYELALIKAGKGISSPLDVEAEAGPKGAQEEQD